MGYDESTGTKNNCRTISAAVAYDLPINGECVIVIFHQSIHIPGMEHNLVCPMQVRINGVYLNDTPLLLTKNPTPFTHVMVFDTKNAKLNVPLRLTGVTSYFNSRKSTQDEFENSRRYVATYDAPEWDPNSLRFRDMEDEYLTDSGRIKDKGNSNIGSQGRGLQMFVSLIQLSIDGNSFDNFDELFYAL